MTPRRARVTRRLLAAAAVLALLTVACAPVPPATSPTASAWPASVSGRPVFYYFGTTT